MAKEKGEPTGGNAADELTSGTLKPKPKPAKPPKTIGDVLNPGPKKPAKKAPAKKPTAGQPPAAAPAPAAPAPPAASADIVALITRIATEMGVPPQLALAMAQVESGFNPRAVGDNGTSFGLFQLHKGGMLTSANLTPEQAFDPETNARVAIGALAATMRANPGADWGTVAARSQRPADKAGYARKVNGIIGAAGNDYTAYFSSQAPAGGGTVTNPATASATGTPKLPKTATDAEVRAFLERHHPDVAAMVKHPEVGPILLKAAREGWDRATLQGALAGTTWWKTTDARAREWDALVARDGATAKARLGQTMTAISGAADKMGVKLDAAALEKLATNVLRLGWNEQQVTASIVQRIRVGDAVEEQGAALTTVTALKQVAERDFLVQLSDHTLTSWLQAILTGRRTEDDFRAHMTNMALSRYPEAADALSAGQSVRDVADVFVQDAARLLGLHPDSVDLMEEKWSKPLHHVDPKTGVRRMMSRDEWLQELRTNDVYGFDRSANGRQAGAEFRDRVMQRMVGSG